MTHALALDNLDAPERRHSERALDLATTQRFLP